MYVTNKIILILILILQEVDYEFPKSHIQEVDYGWMLYIYIRHSFPFYWLFFLFI